MSSSKARFFNPAVVGLIMLSFFLGTSEYTMIGILPEIADGFGISLTQAGSIVSLFAFAYGLGTPFLAAYVGKYNRFRITMLGISLFALCNLICAIAVNYMVFLVFRILTAVVSGTVVSISMTYAEDVASIPEHIPSVIAGVFSGFSVASVVGVPIASTITQTFGWRAAFITIFVATLALLALLFVKLPRQNRLKAGSILEQFKLFLDKRISIGCAIVFLAGASTYLSDTDVPARAPYSGFHAEPCASDLWYCSDHQQCKLRSGGKQNRHPHAAPDLRHPNCMSAASAYCHP